MANFGLVRVDDRLIHGQVVALWAKHLRANRIVVVDDATANDSFMQVVLRSAAPPEAPVDVVTVGQAPAHIQQHGAADPQRTIILMKTPQVALALKAGGVPLDVLQIGGMGARPGRTPFYKTISASPEELDAFRQLLEQGVRVEIQITPDVRPIPVATLLPG